MTFDLVGNYSFITDPPLFADIGESRLHFAPTNISAGVKSGYVRTSTGEQFELQFSDINLTSNSTNSDGTITGLADFDGVSDFSQVMSGTVNTLAAVIRNRLESFINGGKTYKLNSKI